METIETLKAQITELQNENQSLRKEIQRTNGGPDAGETSSTPYDDAWRTTISDVTRLLIPLINEIFGEAYSDKAQIILGANEGLFPWPEGNSEKRVTDSNIRVIESERSDKPLLSLLGDNASIADGAKAKNYIIECESQPVTGRFLVRIFEYAIQHGIGQGREISGGRLVITLPQCAVLSLRSTRNTRDTLEMVIRTEREEAHSTVRVMKLSDYSIQEIFEKRLYLLLPFLMFNYEKSFAAIEADNEKYERMMEELKGAFARLDALVPEDENEDSLVDEFTTQSLRQAALRVTEAIAVNYPRIREGVGSIVKGQIYDYEAKRIKREGIREGRLEGSRKATIDNLFKYVSAGGMTVDFAAKERGISRNEFLADMKNAGYPLPTARA